MRKVKTVAFVGSPRTVLGRVGSVGSVRTFCGLVLADVPADKVRGVLKEARRARIAASVVS